MMQSIYRHSLLAAILFSLTGLAQADCWEEAGQQFSIAPELLYAIAEQESNLDPRAIGHNRNGSRDIGLMQVNSMHLPQLAKQRITEQTLLNDSCQALKVGAGILADFMRRYGYSWEAVGAYNAGTATDGGAPERRAQYAKKISVRYQRLMTSIKNGGPGIQRQDNAVTAIPAIELPSPAAQMDKLNRLPNRL
jgi:soluble lytic murein transglycosylase-like protein